MIQRWFSLPAIQANVVQRAPLTSLCGWASIFTAIYFPGTFIIDGRRGYNVNVICMRIILLRVLHFSEKVLLVLGFRPYCSCEALYATTTVKDSKNIKMLKDVGMTVPKSRETSGVYMQQDRG